MINHPALRSVNRYFSLLLVLLLLAFLILAYWAGIKIAYSVALGGGVCLGPTWLFAWIFLRESSARKRRQIAFNFYWGEGVKLMTTIALFTLVFMNINVHALGFFSGFIAMQWLMWLSPLMIK